MTAILIILSILIIAFVAMLIYSFNTAFYSKKRIPPSENTYPMPNGDEYEPYKPLMKEWMIEARAMNPQKFSIITSDGLTLKAKYYHNKDNAPIELMFHGYRGTGEKDLCGGVQRCRQLGHNAFIVDQRGAGESDGNVISFGVKEHNDCYEWINFITNHFGNDTKIILCGISMGASTVLLAASENLPSNVVGVLADCGYSSAKDIIKKVCKEMHFPPAIVYPIIRLSGKLFGKFDINDGEVKEKIKNCKIPVIIIHGEADDFVPCYMANEIYDNVKSKKKLLIVPDAGHGLSYIVDKNGYLKTLENFWNETGIYERICNEY